MSNEASELARLENAVNELLTTWQDVGRVDDQDLVKLHAEVKSIETARSERADLLANHECPACEGTGCVATGQFDHNGDYIEAACPTCNADLSVAEAARVLLDEVTQIDHFVPLVMARADCCNGPTVHGDYLAMFRAALRALTKETTDD